MNHNVRLDDLRAAVRSAVQSETVTQQLTLQYGRQRLRLFTLTYTKTAEHTGRRRTEAVRRTHIFSDFSFF